MIRTIQTDEITKNIKGLQNIPGVRAYAEEIIENKSFNSIPNLQNNQVLVQSLAIYCILQLSPLLIMNRF